MRLKIWCAAISFAIAAASVVHLHAHKHLTASLMAVLLYVLSMVFLLLKGIGRAKIDLDDQSLELDAKDQK